MPAVRVLRQKHVHDHVKPTQVSMEYGCVGEALADGGEDRYSQQPAFWQALVQAPTRPPPLPLTASSPFAPCPPPPPPGSPLSINPWTEHNTAAGPGCVHSCAPYPEPGREGHCRHNRDSPRGDEKGQPVHHQPQHLQRITAEDARRRLHVRGRARDGRRDGGRKTREIFFWCFFFVVFSSLVIFCAAHVGVGASPTAIGLMVIFPVKSGT